MLLSLRRAVRLRTPSLDPHAFTPTKLFRWSSTDVSSTSSAVSRPVATYASMRASASAAAALALISVAGTAGGVAYQGWARSRDEQAVQALPLYSGNPIVYLDIADHGVPLGRVVIQLRADVTPLAARNFLALCVAPLGYGYKSSAIHGLEKGARVFGGDFFGTGDGAYSIYGTAIPDESFDLQHIGPGCVGLRSYGPDQNSSQFYISLRRLPHLDGAAEVVGHVREGWGVLAALDKAGKTNGRFTSEHDFRVAACGELVDYAPHEAREAPPVRTVSGGGGGGGLKQ